jgi:hypothetical protein
MNIVNLRPRLASTTMEITADISKLTCDIPREMMVHLWKLNPDIATIPTILISRWYPEYFAFHKASAHLEEKLGKEVHDFIMDQLPKERLLSEKAITLLIKSEVIAVSNITSDTLISYVDYISSSTLAAKIGLVRITSSVSLSVGESWLLDKILSRRYGPIASEIPISAVYNHSLKTLQRAHRITWLKIGKKSMAYHMITTFTELLKGDLSKYNTPLECMDQLFKRTFTDQEMAAVIVWYNTYHLTPTLDLAIAAHEKNPVLDDIIDMIRSI